jgi:hypothetical protein
MNEESKYSLLVVDEDPGIRSALKYLHGKIPDAGLVYMFLLAMVLTVVLDVCRKDSVKGDGTSGTVSAAEYCSGAPPEPDEHQTQVLLPSGAIPFAIGEVDPRFNIPRSKFLSLVNEAARVWGSSVHRELFRYDSCAPFKINLKFDNRQANFLSVKRIGLGINIVGKTTDELRETYYSQAVNNWNGQSESGLAVDVGVCDDTSINIFVIEGDNDLLLTLTHALGLDHISNPRAIMHENRAQCRGAASREFVRVTFGDVPAADKDQVRRDLLVYCALDTEGMVDIVRALYELADRGSI